MIVKQLKFPEKLDLESVLHFAMLLDDCANCDQVRIDVGVDRWFPPFSMLFLATKIRHFKNSAPHIKLLIYNYKNHEYPAHMGFFAACGIEYGRKIGEAWGNRNYLPITSISRNQLYESDFDKYSEIQDLIQRKSDQISAIISRDFDKKTDFYNVFTYSMRELMRNTFEHSQCTELFYCIQYWPSRNKIELSIADSGIGVKQALSENPNFRNLSNKESVEMSLMPSVSGKIHSTRVSDVWFNSGYGLFMTSELARHGGNFVIVSGDIGIYLSRKTKMNYRTSFSGTAVRINLDITQIGFLANRINEFRDKGAKIAAKLRGSAQRPPSAMSLLIRRDFL
jgi:hypothetical protein